MTRPTVPYDNFRDDSRRWLDLSARAGDIVISTPSKSGTTWLQMICGLLIFQTSDLPAPLAELSPWLDLKAQPAEAVLARLEAQEHRRFIKTHTPLDGLPLNDEVTYIVGARHPLDAAISLYHQIANIDYGRIAQQQNRPAPAVQAQPPLRDWLLAWIHAVVDPRQQPVSLQAVLHHESDAWSRRSAPNVVLVHYADLSADLAGQMRALADVLKIAVPEARWPELVEAATFTRMRAHGDLLAPAAMPLKDRTAFFRNGRSGEGRELLKPEELADYTARAAGLAPADLLEWLHRP